MKNKPILLNCEKPLLRPLLRFLCLAFFIISTTAKAQFTEDFSDGDLSTDPKWFGDLASFTTTNAILQSDHPVPNSSFYLSTPLSYKAGFQWMFNVRLAFNTSSLNYCDVYVSADTLDLNNVQNGYFIRMGGTQDEISLYKIENAVETKIIDGRNGRCNHSDNNFLIKLILTQDSVFQLSSDSTGSGNFFLQEGSSSSMLIFPSVAFGIKIRQSTSSFMGKHYFDNIYTGKIPEDTVSPVLRSFELKNADRLELCFSEPVNTSGAPGGILKIETNTNHTIVCNQSNSFKNCMECELMPELENGKTYRFIIQDLEDDSGNRISDTTLEVMYYKTEVPEPPDLLITEFLPEPFTQNTFPVEFIELQNHSEKFLELKGCTIGDNGGYAVLPDLVLRKKDYLVVCKKGDEKYFPGVKVVGVEGFRTLNNSGDLIVLRNSAGVKIHETEYSEFTYQDPVKSKGGWSIEMIDPELPCSKNNYKASEAPQKASPGGPNSVNGINTMDEDLEIVSIRTKAPDQLTLTMSHSADSLYCVNTKNYQSELPISHIIVEGKQLQIVFKDSFNSSKKYTLHISMFKDCSGKELKDTTVPFAMARDPVMGDIIFSEILFNPKTGGSDFLEVYNLSEKYIDPAGLILCTFDEKGLCSDNVSIDSISGIFPPKTYRVFTKDKANIIQTYPTHEKNNVFMNELPSLDDKKGHVLLLNRKLQTLDELNYNENMHHPFLKDKNGVSLERTSFKSGRSGSGNFVSAAATYGYGTPGVENSHSTDDEPVSGELKLYPNCISPNDDGYNDYLSIALENPCSECQASVYIFDSNGFMEKVLVKNESLGNQQYWNWNGLNERNIPVKTGIYILMAEVFGINKKTIVYRKTFTVCKY